LYVTDLKGWYNLPTALNPDPGYVDEDGAWLQMSKQHSFE
jgi:hypothetical protein